MKTLNVALAKGRLADLSMEFFRKSGIVCPEFDDPKRKLIPTDKAAASAFSWESLRISLLL